MQNVQVSFPSIDDPWNLVQNKVEELLVQDILVFSDEIFLTSRLACAFLNRVRPWTEVGKLSLENIEDLLRRLGIRLSRKISTPPEISTRKCTPWWQLRYNSTEVRIATHSLRRGEWPLDVRGVGMPRRNSSERVSTILSVDLFSQHNREAISRYEPIVLSRWYQQSRGLVSPFLSPLLSIQSHEQ